MAKIKQIWMQLDIATDGFHLYEAEMHGRFDPQSRIRHASRLLMSGETFVLGDIHDWLETDDPSRKDFSGDSMCSLGRFVCRLE
jgi:hypothetical protein